MASWMNHEHQRYAIILVRVCWSIWGALFDSQSESEAMDRTGGMLQGSQVEHFICIDMNLHPYESAWMKSSFYTMLAPSMLTKSDWSSFPICFVSAIPWVSEISACGACGCLILSSNRESGKLKPREFYRSGLLVRMVDSKYALIVW